MNALQLTLMVQEHLKRRRATAGIFVLVGGLSMLGLLVDFAPAVALRSGPMVFAMIVLGCMGTLALKRHGERLGTWKLGLARGVAAVTVLLFLLSGMAWLIFAKAIPWAYTLALGKTYREPHTMQAHYSKSRYGCAYQLRGGPMESSFPSFVCVSPGFYARHPEQVVKVEVSGLRSALGTQVESVREAP